MNLARRERVELEAVLVGVNGVGRRPGEAAVEALGEVAARDEDVLRTAAGSRFAGMDSEGVEAEVFFDTGPYAAGRARVQPAACAGRWDIDLDRSA